MFYCLYYVTDVSMHQVISARRAPQPDFISIAVMWLDKIRYKLYIYDCKHLCCLLLRSSNILWYD